MSNKPPRAPRCPQRPWQETRHGITRQDPYHWLKDLRWREVMRDPALLDPDIRAYLEAENAHTEAVMAPEAGLRETLFAEMKARIKEDDWTYPSPDGPFAYYRRYVTGGEHALFCRRPRASTMDAGGVEELLLDGNREAEGKSYFKLAACRHSPDHRRLAYASDENGSEYFTIRVRDLDSDALLPETIERAQGDLVWSADGNAFCYTVLDEGHRPHRVYLHILGTDPREDRLLYEEKDPGFFLGLEASDSRRFIIISAHDHVTSEVRLVSADDPAAAPFLVASREAGRLYSVADWGERLFILTNAGDAVDFKIAEAPLVGPDVSNWRDLVAHRSGRFISDMLLFDGHLVRLERAQALPRIVVRRLSDGAEHEIAFTEEAYDLALVPGFEFATRELRFRYSSMTTPQRLYAYDMESRCRRLLKEQEIPCGHDPDAYVTRRLTVRAADGAEVPVSLLHRKDRAPDGTAPCLLYGYGAYGLSMPAGFSGNRFSLVDRGFVYAIVHVRGGSEKGYGWYLDGKLEKKENTFTDFIAAAEALVDSGYTAAGCLVAHGGSAGGMLMGVVANRCPALFAAVLAEVPFVDVLNTMSDKDLPLTPPEWPEWGNPIDSAEAYRRIAAYSPYENLDAQAYPAIIATAGLTDPRVTYWEPAKWVARARTLKTDGQPLLLRTNMEAGHGGAAGRFERLEEIALLYAFALKVLDITG
jgi:oligopeptidase B